MTDVKLTRAGVCYDLERSPFSLKVSYYNFKIEFCFSSEFYKKKFMDSREEALTKLLLRIKLQIPIEFNLDFVSDIVLYSKIEKRGFYIRVNDQGVTCLENLHLGAVLGLK